MSQKDDSKIEKASTDLKEISRANNYLQYYYYAWSSEIIYFLNQQRSLLALQKAEKMKKQAFADRYPYGIFSCIRTMGHIYKSRGNFDLSAQYYQEALDYMLKNMPDQDPSQLYSNLAEYYRNTQKITPPHWTIAKSLEERQNRTEHSPCHDREMPDTIPAGAYR